MQEIWFFHSSNELYGSDRVLLEIISGLDKNKWRVRVILPDDLDYQPLLSEKLLALGVQVESQPLAVLRRRYQSGSGLLKLGWLLLRSVPKLAWTMRRQPVRLVYTNTGVVLSGAVAAKLAGAKHIWGLKEQLPPGKIRLLLARLYSWLSATITVTSETVRHNLCASYASCQDKIKVINNSVDTDRFQLQGATRSRIRAELGLTSEAIVAAMIGRVVQTKGPEVFIAAAQKLQPEFPNACFLIVGGAVPGEDFYVESLKEKVQQAGLAQVVRFLDFQPNIVPLLSALDVLVIPSLRPEGFGLTAVEAMAMACPVVAAGHGGPTETIEAGVTGLLYNPPADANVLANCLAELFSQPDLRHRMGTNGRATATSRFNRTREVEAYCQLFEDSL